MVLPRLAPLGPTYFRPPPVAPSSLGRCFAVPGRDVVGGSSLPRPGCPRLSLAWCSGTLLFLASPCSSLSAWFCPLARALFLLFHSVLVVSFSSPMWLIRAFAASSVSYTYPAPFPAFPCRLLFVMSLSLVVAGPCLAFSFARLCGCWVSRPFLFLFRIPTPLRPSRRLLALSHLCLPLLRTFLSRLSRCFSPWPLPSCWVLVLVGPVWASAFLPYCFLFLSRCCAFNASRPRVRACFVALSLSCLLASLPPHFPAPISLRLVHVFDHLRPCAWPVPCRVLSRLSITLLFWGTFCQSLVFLLPLCWLLAYSRLLLSWRRRLYSIRGLRVCWPSLSARGFLSSAPAPLLGVSLLLGFSAPGLFLWAFPLWSVVLVSTGFLSVRLSWCSCRGAPPRSRASSRRSASPGCSFGCCAGRAGRCRIASAVLCVWVFS